MEKHVAEPTFEDYAARLASYSKLMDFKSFRGIATFFRANLSDDWKNVDIGLIGLPIDNGLTQRSGARHGPRELRNQSCSVMCFNPMTNVIPFEFARIADIGDVPFDSGFNLDRIIPEVREFYVKLHKAGVVPITAGGDHSITYPILQAIAVDEPVGVVHIDAHLDAADQIGESNLHHGVAFKRSVVDGVADPKRIVHIAIRDPAKQFEQFAEDTGQTVIDIDRFYDLGVKGVIEETRRIIGNGPVYISFDVDGLDPAYAPGTGTPVVGGITSYEARRLLQGLRGLDVIGADLVEVSPPFDSANITSLAGAQMMFEMLCLAAEAFSKRTKR